MLLRLTIVLFITCLFNEVYAQTCTQRLEEAMRAYYGGNLREVETILDYTNCAENLTKEQRVNALRIIVISNLFLKEQEEAEEAMLKLLKVNPEYKLTDADPPEFEHIYRLFKIKELFSIGVYIGTNYGFYNISKNKTISSIKEEFLYKFSDLGINIGLIPTFHLTENWWLQTGIGFQTRKYRLGKTIWALAGQNPFIEIVENQQYLDIPLNVRYIINKWKFKPTLITGINYSQLIYSKAYIEGNNTSIKEYLFSSRNKSYLEFQVGVGVLQKINKNIFGINIQYKFSTQNQSKYNWFSHGRSSYLIPEYFDQDFTADILTLNLTYQWITNHKIKSK